MKIHLLIFTIYYLLFTIDSAHASSLSLSVSPTIIRIAALPGGNSKSPITIKNLGDSKVNLKIGLKPFSASKSETGDVIYANTNPPIFEKIQVLEADLPIDNVSLAPRQTKTLNLDIKIPTDEPLSDYYFSVIFISNNNKMDDVTIEDLKPNEVKAKSIIAGGIATNVLLSVGNMRSGKGQIIEFSSRPFLDKGPVPFTIRVRNAGQHFITTRGSILIKNMFGQTVGKADLKPINILAQTTRTIPHASWSESLLLGIYSATLAVSLSDQGPTLTETLNFVAFPLRLVIGFFLTILIVLIIKSRVKEKLADKD